jgi:hypothetical protein
VDETALVDEFRDELAADLFTHLNVTLEASQIIDLDWFVDGGQIFTTFNVGFDRRLV